MKKNITVISILTVALISVLFCTSCKDKTDKKNKSAAQSDTLSINNSPTVNLTFDKHGTLWAVWSDAKYVYVNYSKDYAQTFSVPVKVNKIHEVIAAERENRPKIALGPNDNIYVTYSIRLKKKYTGNVKFSRSTDHGKSFSKPVKLNDDKQITGHSFDALGVSPRGYLYVVWLDGRIRLKDETYKGLSLFYTMSKDGGKTFISNTNIKDHTCECCRLWMDFDKDGLPIIVGRGIYGTNIRDHFLVKFNDIEKSAKPIRVTYENWQVDGCPHHGPAIAIDNKDIYHFTWFNVSTDGPHSFYARSTDKGKTFSDKIIIGGLTASHPDVIVSGNNVYITWQEFHNNKTEVYYMISNDEGKSWQSPVKIITSDGTTDRPFLIKDKNNVFVYCMTSKDGLKFLKILD